VDNLLSWADYKLKKDLKKTDGTKRSNILGIPKLDDANDAGGKDSDKCTLILTEGDSAKALAVSNANLSYAIVYTFAVILKGMHFFTSVDGWYRSSWKGSLWCVSS
jgi:DNA gyrase/topoisomerase IV subunit B